MLIQKFYVKFFWKMDVYIKIKPITYIIFQFHFHQEYRGGDKIKNLFFVPIPFSFSFFQIPNEYFFPILRDVSFLSRLWN